MAVTIPVEKVEPGDRAVLWVVDAPQAVYIKAITESESGRTFLVSHAGAPIEVHVPYGHTVDLAC